MGSVQWLNRIVTRVLRIIKHRIMLSHLAIDLSSLWLRSNAQHRHVQSMSSWTNDCRLGSTKLSIADAWLSKDHFSHAIKSEAQDTTFMGVDMSNHRSPSTVWDRLPKLGYDPKWLFGGSESWVPPNRGIPPMDRVPKHAKNPSFRPLSRGIY